MGAAYEVASSGRDRAEWLRARKEGIGGSDAAAIVGVNPYSSPLSVYVEKLELGDSDPDGEVSEQARWGKILEPHVIEEFRRRSGRTIRRDGRLLRSRRRPWQLATLDARQWDPKFHPGPGLVEAKSTRFNWERIPDDCWAQLQHQFAVTGFQWGSFVVLDLMRREIHDVDVAPDPDYQRELIEREAEFWSDLTRGVAPDPDGTAASAKALRLLYPDEVPGKTIELSSELGELSDELQELKRRTQVDRYRREEIEIDIKAALGDAEVGLFADGTGYTYRTQERREHVQHASTFRALRFTRGES